MSSAPPRRSARAAAAAEAQVAARAEAAERAVRDAARRKRDAEAAARGGGAAKRARKDPAERSVWSTGPKGAPPGVLFLCGDNFTASEKPVEAFWKKERGEGGEGGEGKERVKMREEVDLAIGEVGKAKLENMVEDFDAYWKTSTAARDAIAKAVAPGRKASKGSQAPKRRGRGAIRAFRHVGWLELDAVSFEMSGWAPGAETGAEAVRVAAGYAASAKKGLPDYVDSFAPVSNRLFNMVDVLDNQLGSLMSLNPRTKRLVAALNSLTAERASQWPVPLMLAMCSCQDVAALRAAAQTGQAASSGASTRKLKVQVFAGRLLFELIACPEIELVFSELQVGYELPKMPEFGKYPAKFGRSAPAADEDPYSFAALLRRAENVGYREMDWQADEKIKAGLTVPLLPFQRDTVQFMIDRDTDRFALNDYYWRALPYLPQGQTRRPADTASAAATAPSAPGEARSFYYYFPLSGEVRLREPPRTRGAAICEDMGLGKTLEATALILATTLGPEVKTSPSVFNITVGEIDCPVGPDGFVSSLKTRLANRDQGSTKLQHRDPVLRYGDVVLDDFGETTSLDTVVRVKRYVETTTLVILPYSLLYQWRDEVKAKAPSLTIHVWDRDKETRREDLCWGPNAVDVVLATYEQLSYDPFLSRVYWRRLIVDEAQVVRRLSDIASTCFNLRSTSRFLMTGTPITNTINDIRGELAFLKVWPFTLDNDGFWESRVETPWNERSSCALLGTLLDAMMMRHSKNQPGLGIQLPPRSYKTEVVRMERSSRAVYLFIRGCIDDELERLSSPDYSGTELRNLRALFHCLRLACISGELVQTFALDFARRLVWARRANAAHQHALSNAGAAADTGVGGGQGQAFIRVVSGSEALEFMGAASQAGGVNRDTRRRLAAIEEPGAHAFKAYQAMSHEQLSVEAVRRKLVSEESVSKVSQARLVGLLAGGQYKLDTDTLEHMRRQCFSASLLTEDESKSASRGRCRALLLNHQRLLRGVDADGVVSESGFSALSKLVDVGEAPTCPVCLEDCHRPCVTGCAHFYCRECILLLLASSQRCAICRSVVTGVGVGTGVVEVASSSIGQRKARRKNGDGDEGANDEDYVQPTVDDEEEIGDIIGRTDSAPSRGVIGASEGTSTDGGNHGDDGSQSSNCPSPRTTEDFEPGAAWREYAEIPTDAQFSSVSYNPMLPSLNATFLRHLAAARMAPSKFNALLNIILNARPESKFVVVANAASTLRTCGLWLKKMGIDCVGVGMDMTSAATRIHSRAASEFRNKPAVRVFLLNAVSASGLTLTSAEYVVFLEPLTRKADEIQASARVHRIGQTRPVHVIRIVVESSIEAKIFALRGGTNISNAAEEAAALVSPTSARGNAITDDAVLGAFGYARDAQGRVYRRSLSDP